MNILVLNGPNLNLLGSRESNIYGEESLNEIEKKLFKLAEDNSFSVNFFQSNAEHELIDCIHNSKENNISAIIFNPAAFTHTSIALRDVSGKVVSIEVDDAQPVEFGQTIIVIN